MNNKKFTPGPWKAFLNEPFAAIEGHLIKKDDDVMRPIASLWKGGGLKGKPEQIANAHLIAAAPELFGALKKHCKKCKNSRNNMNMARACEGCSTGKAIKKALGESK